MKNEDILVRNKAGWDLMAEDWAGSTELPSYGPTAPTEDTLNLFGSLQGKKILDIGCGSGHSLLYNAGRGAEELWGLDLSTRQIENAKALLSENGLSAHLFASPMENNPGIPTNYFDVVYSIYAFGWTTDLRKSIRLVQEYLKPSGVFVFSWDNPLMPCIHAEDGTYILCRSYLEEATIELEKGKQPLIMKNWKLSSYINELSAAGFRIDKMIEETDKDILGKEQEFSTKYYAKHRARYINESFIIKAVKG